MQVILKPAGVAFVALAIVGLVVLAIVKNRPNRPATANLATGTIADPKNSRMVPAVIGKEKLVNGGFEGGFPKYQGIAPTDTLNISGNIAENWADNSGWAKIAIVYDKDTKKPHSGLSSQKMTVSKKRFGHAQIAQTIEVPPRTKLTATVWIRADRPTKGESVDVWLRDKDDITKIYGRQFAAVTTEWRPFTVSGTVTESTPTVFMVLVVSPDITVWLDDASVKAIP